MSQPISQVNLDDYAKAESQSKFSNSFNKKDLAMKFNQLKNNNKTIIKYTGCNDVNYRCDKCTNTFTYTWKKIEEFSNTCYVCDILKLYNKKKIDDISVDNGYKSYCENSKVGNRFSEDKLRSLYINCLLSGKKIKHIIKMTALIAKYECFCGKIFEVEKGSLDKELIFDVNNNKRSCVSCKSVYGSRKIYDDYIEKDDGGVAESKELDSDDGGVAESKERDSDDGGVGESKERDSDDGAEESKERDSDDGGAEESKERDSDEEVKDISLDDKEWKQTEYPLYYVHPSGKIKRNNKMLVITDNNAPIRFEGKAYYKSFTQLLAKTFKLKNYEKIDDKGWIVKIIDDTLTNKYNITNLKVMTISMSNKISINKKPRTVDIPVDENKKKKNELDNNINIKSIKLYNDRYILYSSGELWSEYKQGFMAIGTDSHGYKRLYIEYNGKRINIRLHRLLCEHFIYPDFKVDGIKKPFDKYEIDHIDRDKLNNNIFNLRVVTRTENNENRDKKNLSNGTIYQYNRKDGKFINEYESANKASKSTGIKQPSISNMINGKDVPSSMYYFSYDKTDCIEVPDYDTVHQYELSGQYIDTYISVKKASEETMVAQGTIKTQCKNGKRPKNLKYLWSYTKTKQYGVDDEDEDDEEDDYDEEDDDEEEE